MAKILIYEQGEAYLIKNNIVDEKPMELAKFVHTATRLRADIIRKYLNRRYNKSSIQ